MSDICIGREGSLPPDVLELARRHRAWASEHSPPEDVHAVEAEELRDPALTLLSARDQGGALLGIGALRELDPHHAELKAMHVRETSRGLGIGRALVHALMAVAVERGYLRLSLETGTMDAFASARSLYASLGFRPCPPFGQHTSSAHSVCMTMLLSEQPEAP